ncbi:MAG TPA: zinc-ribbon domain-containing protein [Diaminobutyricibacter sp.]|uniref:zinc-ribbon domain-containing protein n=1 Tax=Leifsonia sp. McL0618 TaxID=3415677 RepID=UPI003384B694
MPESVQQWWARRQWTKGMDVPYPVGRYRTDWERYPTLIRQYHPDLNSGIVLSQVPPGADVYLVWECDSGHRFVATPEEQRSKPDGSRRRSTWCPECAALAQRRRAPMGVVREPVPAFACGHPRDPRAIGDLEPGERCALCRRLGETGQTREALAAKAVPGRRPELLAETRTDRRYSWICSKGHPSFEASVDSVLRGRGCPTCRHAAAAADRYPVGAGFVSPWAPKPASAVEAKLRQRLGQVLEVDLSLNAVKVAKPFYSHVEVWPDIVIDELKVAIEYDTTGRDGLEHVGRRELSDKRKDRLLRSAGWEVIRIRCGKLQPIGPYDLTTSGVSDALVGRLLDRLREVRGALIVDAYRARAGVAQNPRSVVESTGAHVGGRR